MMADANCPFCAAAQGNATTPVVFEGDVVFGLTPLRPATLGHTLVIPRAHIPDIWALDPADARPLTEAVLQVATAIREALKPDGLNVITSAGAAATQTVPHLHIHLVPRWEGDTFGPIWPDPHPEFTDAEISETAAAIRARLGYQTSNS